MEQEAKCSCQYGNDWPDFTPRWYVSVKTCLLHAGLYDPLLAPEWAGTDCGAGGREVIRDKRVAEASHG